MSEDLSPSKYQNSCVNPIKTDKSLAHALGVKKKKINKKK